MAEENDSFLHRIPYTGPFKDIADWLNANFRLIELAIKQNTGKSAYEVWRDYTDGQGNQPNIDKTEQEFLASLKESGYKMQAVMARPSAIANIAEDTIYLYPDGTGQWSSAIYTGDLSESYDSTKWIVLATNTGDLSEVFADIQNLFAMVGHYECSTAAATSTKAISAPGYVLTNGGNIRIKMEYANTAASPVTLQIGNAAAKELYYNGEAVSGENTWEDNEVITVYYDGTRYQSQINKGGITDADFAEANVEDGGIYTDGSVSNSEWCHNKEYIPVSEGDIIRWRSGNAFSANDANRLNNVLCYYKSDFSKKTYFTYTQQDRVLSDSSAIVPADVAYIRASFRKENGYGIDIKHSGESSFTTVFTVETRNGKYKDIHKIPSLEESVNDIAEAVFVEPNVAPGGFYFNTGAVMASDWCHNVDYIEVNNGDTITWKAGDTVLPQGTDRDNNCLIVYNANKEKISYFGYKEINRSFTLDNATAHYIRASFPYEDGYSIEVNGVTVFKTVIAKKDRLQDIAADAADAKAMAENVNESLLDYNTIYSKIGYYFGKSGNTTVLVADNQWGLSVKIPCEYNDTIIIGTSSDITQTASPQRYMNFYDASDNFIDYWAIRNRNDVVLSDIAYQNVAYGIMSVRLADADKFTVKVNGELKYTGVVYTPGSNVYEKVKNMLGEYAPTSSLSGSHTSYMPLCGFERKDFDNIYKFSTKASTTVVLTQIMQIPYKGVCFDIRFPNAYTCKIQYGTMNSDATSSLVSTIEASTISTPFASSAEIRFAFLKKDGGEVTPSQIQALVDSGEISISYNNSTPDVVQKNIACEPYTKAVMCSWSLDGQLTSFKNIPVFAHFSDLHGDVVRLKNIMEYCKYLGVDAVLNTGDSVQTKAVDGMATYHDIVGSYDIPTLLCVGNHDAWYTGDSRNMTQNEKLYTDVIQPNSELFGYTLPAAADYDDAATYYYRDFASLNIRVISVNLYEQNIGYWAYYGRISKKQIDWLIATLASTPAGYGVIIMTHTNTEKILIDSNHSEFFDVARPAPYDGSVDQQVKLTGDNSTGDPIVNIVDAFISGTSYSGSYTQAISGNTTETISYEADFTSLNSGVEFICYVCGHHHADFIGYLRNTTNRQLALDITTAQSLYGKSKAGDGDLIRGGQGATEDAFNIYGIDRVAGTVKIARVGANMTSSLAERKYMEIPYRDNS